MELADFIALVHRLGLTFGIGSSTFALTFYIKGLADGYFDSSEKNFMGVVFFVLRLGMVLIGLALLLRLLAPGGEVLLSNPIYLMEWTLLLVITVNAVLMTVHKIPMWLGPTLAGGSWFAFFFLTTLPLEQVLYTTLLLSYLLFLLFFHAVFRFLFRRFTKPAGR